MKTLFENKRKYFWGLKISLFFLFPLTSGCHQEATIRGQINSQLPQGLIVSTFTVQKGHVWGVFSQGNTTASLTTSVSITGTLNGAPFTGSYNATITACGNPGDHYDLSTDDPLILQFPSDAGSFSGTYDDGMGSSGSLIIQSGLTSIPTYPGQSLVAESGNQLVLVGLPGSLPDGTYNFRLSFSLSSIRAINVKPVIAQMVMIDNNTYYPPQVPNISAFTKMPSLTVPVSASLVDISLPLDGISGATILNFCSQFIPTLTQWGIIILGIMILTIGSVYLYKRKISGITV